MKKITKVTISFLSGLLVLLGFGGCKASKKAVQENQDNVPTKNISVNSPNGPGKTYLPDSIANRRVLYGPPPAKIRK